MPKKTKKEKILAKQRRLVSPSVVSSSASTPIENQPVKSTFTFNASHSGTTRKLTNDDAIELGVIKHDLAKTLIIASIAIAFELSVYWLLNVKH
jgi:hypothetical protein